MNMDIIKGNWEQLKGSVKSTWGELTDDEVAEMNGDAQKLSGKLQEKYGKSKDEAEKEINEWQERNAA